MWPVATILDSVAIEEPTQPAGVQEKNQVWEQVVSIALSKFPHFTDEETGIKKSWVAQYQSPVPVLWLLISFFITLTLPFSVPCCCDYFSVSQMLGGCSQLFKRGALRPYSLKNIWSNLDKTVWRQSK